MNTTKNIKYAICSDMNGINIFHKIRRFSQVKLFNAIVTRADKELKWIASSEERNIVRRLCKVIGGKEMSMQTMYYDLQFFLRMEILTKVSRGVYKVNSELIEVLETVNRDGISDDINKDDLPY